MRCLSHPRAGDADLEFFVKNFLEEVSDTFKNFQKGVMWILWGVCALFRSFPAIRGNLIALSPQ